MPRLIGQKEITNHVQLSWNTLRQWIDKAGFPAIKLGGTWISHTDAIDKWFKEIVHKCPSCTNNNAPTVRDD